MKLCIFEDNTFENFYPITLTRPSFDLRCGHTLLYEKILRAFPDTETCFFVRDWIAPTFRKRVEGKSVNDLSALNDDILIINGCTLFIDTDIQAEGDEEIGIMDNTLVYARVKKQTLDKCRADSFEAVLRNIKQVLPKKEISVTLISYLWELIHHNGKAIEDDFDKISQKGIFGNMAEGAIIYGDKSKVHIGKGSEIQPHTIIETAGGPVIIDEDVTVTPFTRIEGPCSIGKGSTLFGTKLREGSSIGPVCRVGGEIEESIIHGYSNKYHDGFLGHAYIGEWVNLGALTTNSDLKNDYGSVQVYIKGQLFDTNDTKVGCFIGDYAKTSIGILLNTGTSIGVLCILVASGGVLPKYIPSLAWYYKGKIAKGYGLETMLATVKTSMNRRKKELTEEDIELLRYIKKITQDERNTIVRKARKGNN